MLAREIVAKIDSPQRPPYVVARLTTELRALLCELDGETAQDDPEAIARRLLRGVGVS